MNIIRIPFCGNDNRTNASTCWRNSFLAAKSKARVCVDRRDDVSERVERKTRTVKLSFPPRRLNPHLDYRFSTHTSPRGKHHLRRSDIRPLRARPTDLQNAHSTFTVADRLF